MLCVLNLFFIFFLSLALSFNQIYLSILGSRFIDKIDQVYIPEEIRGSEIRKRRGSTAAAEGESGLLVRPDHRRGWRKSRRAFRIVTRDVSLTDGGANRRFGIALLLVRVEFRATATTRRTRDFGPAER